MAHLTLSQRRLVSRKIAQAYRAWRARYGEPTEHDRRIIASVGFKEARKTDPKIPAAANPLVELPRVMGPIGPPAAVPFINMAGRLVGKRVQFRWGLSLVPYQGTVISETKTHATVAVDRVMLRDGRIVWTEGSGPRRVLKQELEEPDQWGEPTRLNPLLMTVVGANPDFAKGSPEAKAHMAKLRAMAQKKRMGGKSKCGLCGAIYLGTTAMHKYECVAQGAKLYRQNPLTTAESKRIVSRADWHKRQADESRDKGLYYGAAYFGGRVAEAEDVLEQYGFSERYMNPMMPGDPGENPRLVHQQILRAFFAGRPRHLAGRRYYTDGQRLLVWGNLVAERRPEGVYITDAGWRTLLTRSVLNALLEEAPRHGVQGGRIYQQAYRWYFKPDARGAKPIEWTGGMVLGMATATPVTVPAANPSACPKVCLNPMHGHQRNPGARRVSRRARGPRKPTRVATRAPRRVAANPGRRRFTISLDEFARRVKATRDPKLWRAFLAKVKGYKQWTHGSDPRTVTLEAADVPGLKGMWITYGAGKLPDSTYMMPPGSKRKGAWKHKWESMPDLKNDPEAGIVISRLRGKSKISDFYHR